MCLANGVRVCANAIMQSINIRCKIMSNQELRRLSTEQCSNYVSTFVGKVAVLNGRDFSHTLLATLCHFENNSRGSDMVRKLYVGIRNAGAKTMLQRLKVVAWHVCGIEFKEVKETGEVSSSYNKTQYEKLPVERRNECLDMLAEGNVLALYDLIVGEKVVDPFAKNVYKSKATAIGKLMTEIINKSDAALNDAELRKAFGLLSEIEATLTVYKDGLDDAKKQLGLKLVG